MKKLKIGIVMLLSIILLSLLFSEFNAEVSSLNALTGPSFRHPFGFDSLGRDLLGRVAAGVLVSLSVSLVSVAISMAVGLFLAFMMSKGAISYVAFAMSDSLKLLPIVPLALFLSSIGGPGPGKLIFAMSLSMSPIVARASYSKITILKKERFTLSSYGFGYNSMQVFAMHILPHLYFYIREQAVSLLLSAILMEASLSYLGAGLSVGTPSLGAIVSEAKAYMLTNPLFIAFPSLVLLLLGLSLVLIIKGLSELDSAS